MDTVVISIPCKKAIEYAVAQANASKRKCKPSLKYKWICSDMEKKENGRRFTLKWEPLDKFPTQSYAKLEFHLKEHKNWTECKIWLEKYFGPHFQSVMAGTITRLDLGVNLDMSYREFRAKAVFNTKQTGKDINSTSETLYGGSRKSDNQIVVYKSKEGAARVEVRYKKKAVPVSCLNDLEKLEGLYPFSNVRLYDIDITKTVRPEHHTLVSSFRGAAKSVSVRDALIKYCDGEPSTKRLLMSQLVEVHVNLIPDTWKGYLSSFFDLNSEAMIPQLDKKEFLKRCPPRTTIAYSEFCSSCPDFDGETAYQATRVKQEQEIISPHDLAAFHAVYGEEARAKLEKILKAAVDEFNPLSKIMKKILNQESEDE